MASWVTDITSALGNLGGVAAYADLYREIARIRPAHQLTKSWQASVRRTVEQHSSDSKIFIGEDLFYSVDGIGAGKWGLRALAPNTPAPPDIVEPEVPSRAEVKTYRILRDTELSRGLKALHEHQCQICGTTIELPDGRRYAEGHHIQPLGGIHGGPDITSNILVLCPNHHVMCDYGTIELERESLRLHPSHAVGQRYLDYHNNRIRARKEAVVAPK